MGAKTMSESINKRASDWYKRGDIGLSSKAISRVMRGAAFADIDKGNHPRDPGDLGRCLRLLDLIPEWRASIMDMAPLSTAWANLARNWDELEATFRSEGDGSLSPPHGTPMRKTYNRMRELIEQPGEAVVSKLAPTVGPAVSAQIHPDDATVAAMAMAHWSRHVAATHIDDRPDAIASARRFITEAKRYREAAEKVTP
jgi:hypothetical protein